MLPYQYYLEEMGITPLELREPLPPLETLACKVASCKECPLHATRTQTVFGKGNPKAKLFFIGEAPGFYEDKEGLPFVGRAGMLLDKMVTSIGLSPKEIYIANVIKCRPPNNRDPAVAEIAACQGYLEEQIRLVQPLCIVALGRFAGQFLLKQALPMYQMRTRKISYQAIPCIVTFHPSYLLRNPKEKKKAYQDLLRIQEIVSCLEAKV